MNDFTIDRRRWLLLAGAAFASRPMLSGADMRPFFGLNFGPYKDGQSPADGRPLPPEQIRERMQVIAQSTTWIRTYGVGSGLDAAGRIAHELGLKAAIGAWLGKNSEANQREIAGAIECANRGDADMIIVGSETQIRHDLGIDQLKGYIEKARAAIPKTIPVTTADGHSYWQGNPDLIESVDLVFANDYAYWSGISSEQSIGRLDANYAELVESADGKPVWYSETGWPDEGDSIGAADATPGNAAAYLRDFLAWSREKQIPAFWFSAFDEKWKASAEGPQGAHFGVWSSDATLKPAFGKILGQQH